MTSRADLTELLQVALRAMDIAVATMTRSRPARVIAKGHRDMVSDIDLAVQDAVSEFLAEETPNIAFVSEERQRDESELPGAAWTLDPIDGTANFLRDIPLCGISLALIEDSQPMLGVIDLPYLSTRYQALHDHGAHVGSRRLHVSDVTELSSAIVALGDYRVDPAEEYKNQLQFRLAEHLAHTTLRVRMLGSAAADLAWLADGHVDISITLLNNSWDMAAGVVIAREAGAIVMDLDGKPYSSESAATLATTPHLRRALLDLVASTRADA